MQIAEQLVASGKTSGGLFNKKLTEFVREHGFTKLIETGTYHGTGTTRAIIEGLKGEFTFITIECDPENFMIAKQNLGNIPGVHQIKGLSIGKSDLPVSISEDFPEFIAVDHYPRNRMQLYLKEVSHNVPDHALNAALAMFDYRPEFVILDSAGYMGFQEFRYLMDRIKGDFFLALDDTDHIKHYDTMQFILKDPAFEILWSVRGVSYPLKDAIKDKYGSAIIKYTYPK